ncbi:MAG: VCBS repeat-containing protein [Hyphomicrobiales bacterium]|nr:VCBS repeat-containing protein [Hyphomicrobiales bacterium]
MLRSLARTVAAFAGAIALVFAVSCTGPAASGSEPEEIGEQTIIFDRIEIAEQAGDIKLVGDIDRDELLDLILGGSPGEPLTWWRWPDLHPTQIATARVEFTTDGLLADIDGDGDLDIVTPDGDKKDNLLWFENPRPDGDGAEAGKWRRHIIGSIGSWGKDVESADFDGNGRVDIAARSNNDLMIFFQSGSGDWSKVDLPGFELGDEGMTSGDIDTDGDIDLVVAGEWLANPGGALAIKRAEWKAYTIGVFDTAFKAVVVDLDQDGSPDILTSSSEHSSDVAWFSAKSGPKKKWTRHVVQRALTGAHTLQAADMDLDGDIDIVVGQMHTSPERALAVLYNLDGKGTRWARQVIDKTGLHNGVVADIDGDGDFDIYGANWTGNPPLRVWLNRLDPPRTPRRLDRWHRSQITSDHVRTFGLAFADIDGDKRTDIVSGPFWYRHPSRPWDDEWEQFRLGEGLDAFAVADLDDDGHPEIFAQRGGDGMSLKFVWLGLANSGSRDFKEYIVGEVPRASHDQGSQGHVLADIVPGGLPEIAVSSGNGVFYFESPDDPASVPWSRTHISKDPSDEGIVFVDVDRDGQLDLVATTGDAKEVAWWRNPGDGTSSWTRHEIGMLPEAVFPDRVGAADFDGDGRVDVVVSEENGEPQGAEAFWWRQPEALGDKGWIRRKITSRGSLNSLSVADMDADGDMDIIMGEHYGKMRISIWNNLGAGQFIEQMVGEGAESHLGARAVDLDGDGDLDIVSIAWSKFKPIHVWRNDAVSSALNK